MTTALVVFTDGRRECIAQTIPSVLENLQGLPEGGPRYIFDDSGEPDYVRWLMTHYPDFELVAVGQRRGLADNIAHAWAYLQATLPLEVRWIWHQEDDFTFNRPVDLEDMQRILDLRPQLVQMALLRQPWTVAEKAAGGVLELYGLERFEEWEEYGIPGDVHWLEHREFFTLNPNLYRRSLMTRWPRVRKSERYFAGKLLRDRELRFGYWGSKEAPPAVTHIGEKRNGKGY